MIVGLDVRRVCTRGTTKGLPFECLRQRRHDTLGDLVLNGENIPGFAIEPDGPELISTSAVNQFGGNAHHRARPAHTAGKDVTNSKFVGNVSWISRTISEAQSRGPRGDAQAHDFGKVGDDILGYTVGKILLCLFVGQIDKG